MARERSTPIGFTLVETIVAACITAIIATVMLTLLRMNNDQVSIGALNTLVNMQYSTAVSQIGDIARTATVILDGAEAWSPAPNAALLATKTIKMWDINGAVIGGFNINGTTLQEWKTGVGFIDFHVGDAAASSTLVKVDGASGFSLSSDRKTVTLAIRVVSTSGSRTAYVKSKQEVFTCRN